MTTLTNSEGEILTYTNAFIETILLQLIQVINITQLGMAILYLLKSVFNKVLLLVYTYHMNRTTFQNYTIHETRLMITTQNLFFK